MPTCVIFGCKNRPEMVQQNKNLALTFHRFPIMNPELMSLWMKSIGSDNLKSPNSPIQKSSIVCSDHFETKCFKFAGMRTRLLGDAVPTVFKNSPNPAVASMGVTTSALTESNIHDLKLRRNIRSVKIANIESATKKIVEVPGSPLIHSDLNLKSLPSIEQGKKTFVFLTKNSSSPSFRGQINVPAKKMQLNSSIISITEGCSNISRTGPFDVSPMEEITKPSLVCVVGLNSEPNLRVLDQSTYTDIKKLDGLCRVCLKSTPIMTPIFDDDGNSELVSKIHRHLSIRVSYDDTLPLKLCSNCVQALEAIERLSQLSYENELKLRLYIESSKEAAGEMSNAAQQTELPIVALREETPKVVEISTREEKKTFVCSDCGKSSLNFKSFARHCYSVHKKKKCKWCDTLFATTEEMNAHRIEAHGSTCDSCGIKFKGINTMLKHIRKEHPDFKANMCEKCGKSFISKYSLAAHYETHNLTTPYLCDSCGKSFKSKQKLRHHKCNPDDDEQVRSCNSCQICGNTYTFRSSLQRHLIRHTGNKRFQCHKCAKSFYGAVNLRNHMVVHEKTTVYECQMCCARYYHKRNMITHLKDKHSTQWHYKCPYCVHLFASIDEVVKHRDEMHDCHESPEIGLQQKGPTPFEEFRCKICDRQFENIYALTHHFEEHVIHGPEDLNIKTIGVDGLLECALCGANLTSTWAMRCHIKKSHLGVHQRELLHTCDHCEKQFATKSQLRRHIMQHTGEKPFHCATCNAEFRSSTACKIHMRIHTGETPYHCQKCPKKFRSSAILRTHEVFHSKPFGCELCPQRFSSKLFLKAHIDTHGKEAGVGQKLIVYKCQFCNFISKSRSMVKKHEVITHAELDEEAESSFEQITGSESVPVEQQEDVHTEFSSTVQATFFTL
ncbi:zinc finger protein 11-like isoform X2 [Neocloeon triangulifer]|uniref:zinc finger protein 11-like isoform X2 n=1 Tax=Neocloeon triangulifer TaxID=2078957 RepID=UPI00286F7FC7|nr:zinc finger protein 11-like isoform X2 [Neocloeon triangulifer]